MADTKITLKVSPSEFGTIKSALNEFGNLMRQNANNEELDPASRRHDRGQSVKAAELLKQLES